MSRMCVLYRDVMAQVMNVRRVRGKLKLDTGITLLLLKEPREPAGLSSSFDGQIAINIKYAFITNALCRDLRINPGIFGADTSD